MALYEYKKFQILLNSDSDKTQGLQTGDIVRRQYIDANGVVYSLMCVLDYGIEKITDEETGETTTQSYFIGALLDGSDPQQGEILDFVRVTNLFDVDRSGALYLTASDDEAPYMDILDRIGYKDSLSWPENIEADNFSDPTSQYIVSGKADFTLTYDESMDDCHRVLTAHRQNKDMTGFIGLSQQFYELVSYPQRVLISYKIKASQDFTLDASLAYTDDLKVDASWTEDVTTEWEYKFKVVTIEFSGRHLRTFKLSLSDLGIDDKVYIADFNIILLSSVANFADASTMRIGKLDGIVDSVFGQLEGYGAYLQKLYATTGAHISGTLTAGDENGFGGTFYAGKIHRNCFKNSIDIDFISDIAISDDAVVNPTGMGHIYSTETSCIMYAQSNEWLLEHVGERYCFSMWVYAMQACQIGVQQNSQQVGTVQVSDSNSHQWYRIQVHFDLLKPKSSYDDMQITLLVSYDESTYETISDDDESPDSELVYISAPQLETGNNATQYQATDSQLNYTDDYGAWFARGGIGGTIQNPLLQLNYDGNGSIGTRTKSIELKQDGSGYLANENIQWDSDGNVTFGSGVKLAWENLDSSTQEAMTYRQVTIQGEDTFTLLQNDGSEVTEVSPASITLTLNEVGIESTSSMRQWYYKSAGEYVAIENGNGSTLTVTPDADYWNGESSLTFKIVITVSENSVYTDEFTVKKQYVQGYTIKLTSSNGTNFHNGTVQTIITATVYYKGVEVDMDYVLEHFTLVWSHYSQDDRETEIDLDATVDPENVLTIDHQLLTGEIYRCDLVAADAFEYTFALTLD